MKTKIVKYCWIGIILIGFVFAGCSCRGRDITVPEEYDLSGVIAFSSNRDGDWEIYIMDADGKNQKRLTNSPERESHLSWSPDGERIAFYLDYTGLYIIDADDKNQRRLMDNLVDISFLQWSPDGKKIIFNARRPNELLPDIYCIDADGKNQKRLTNSPDPAIDVFPSWSPDGKKIAFVSDRDDNSEIYVMDADGGNQKRLTNSPGGATSPSWSPDGKRIVFISIHDDNYEIYVMDADGRNQKRLTNNSWSDNFPRWSPDGEKIVFNSNPPFVSSPPKEKMGESRWEIFIINSDGTNQTRLTHDIFGDGFPSWSPDGKRIVFTSDRDEPGNSDIYIMDADGKNVKRLTNNPAIDWQPSFRPIPKEEVTPKE